MILCVSNFQVEIFPYLLQQQYEREARLLLVKKFPKISKESKFPIFFIIKLRTISLNIYTVKLTDTLLIHVDIAVIIMQMKF